MAIDDAAGSRPLLFWYPHTVHLAVPKLEPTVDTLEELAASDEVRMTIDWDTDINIIIGVKALVRKMIITL